MNLIRVSFALSIVIFALAAQNQRPQSPQSIRVIDSISGPVLFKSYCAPCHGANGKGDGPIAPLLNTPPPNLTQLSATHGGRFPRERVEKIISGEDAGIAAHGSREMPVWGPIFSQITWDQDLGLVRIHNLADYIEQIQAAPRK